jgi:hypothetical protein
MGVHRHRGTPMGALTPICNDCGISLCWDIAEEEYDEAREFWDRWVCQDCREHDGQERMSLKTWKRERVEAPAAPEPLPPRTYTLRGMRPMHYQTKDGRSR